MVIAHEMKDPALGEYGGVVIDRTIAKTIGKARADTFASNELKKLTITQNITRFSTNHQKSMARALNIVNGQRIWLLSDSIGTGEQGKENEGKRKRGPRAAGVDCQASLKRHVVPRSLRCRRESDFG